MNAMVLIVTLLASASVRAQDPYDIAIQEAVAAYNESRWDDAARFFEQAHEIDPSARTSRGIGLAAERAGRFVAAWRALTASLADQRRALDAEQRAEVRALLDVVRRRIGFVILEDLGADATIEIDGVVVTASAGVIPVEPGDHRLRMRSAGASTLRSVTVAAGAEVRVSIADAPRTDGSADDGHDSSDGGLTTDAGPTDAGDGGLTSQWWFWTGVGAVVVAAIVVTIVLTSGTSTQDPITGDIGSGGVVVALRFP